jgi:hypothetical protein
VLNIYRVAACYLTFFAAGLAAAEIYSNLAPTGIPYDLNTGTWVVDFGPPDNLTRTHAGFDFHIPAGSFRLSNVEIPLWKIGTFEGTLGSEPVMIRLHDDNGGKPGTVLDLSVLALDAIPSGFPSIAGPLLVDFSSARQPVLTAGHRYWLTASLMPPLSGGTPLMWYSNSLGRNSLRASLDEDELRDSWEIISTRQGAMRLSGDPVPEPGSALVVAPCLLAIAAVLVNRKLQHSAKLP